MDKSKDKIINDLIAVLDAMEGKSDKVSNQGQALDGYSALANFIEIAKQAKLIGTTREVKYVNGGVIGNR